MTTQQAPTKPRLSTPQMLQLMRLEVEKALQHGYPISCMMYGLDGFWEGDLMLHRKVLMPRIFHELKTLTFANKVQGLGVWTEAFQLAVFPHCTPEQVAELAQGMLKRARKLDLEDIPAEEAITLSIGISHNLHQGKVTFESLVEEAESGMGLAQTAGGDRVSDWQAVETELDRLKVELQEQLADLEEVSNQLFGEDDGKDEIWGKQLVSKVLEVFHNETQQTEATVRLEQEVIALLKVELAAWRETSTVSLLLESQKTIENLERRITKLTNSLGATEAELLRVASMKDIDLGVSSIYRTVQGLKGEDEGIEAKKEMLKNIFDANVALRDAMKSKES
jgi:hypothetical protein